MKLWPFNKSKEHGATYAQLMRADAIFAAAGIPPFTDWWKGKLKNFYNHPTATTLVGEVGRGGAKSHTSTKCLVVDVVLGSWNVPSGERHWGEFVSENKDESGQRLDLAEVLLKALQEPYERSGDEIRLLNKPLGFKTFACRVGAVSGFRAVAIVDDELAKQMADPDSAKEASEILTSSLAMTVTHPKARKFLISSPVGKNNIHAIRVNQGSDRNQVVVQAPTWVANPSVTEEETHALEPDFRKWEREYKAKQQEDALAAFPIAITQGAFGRRPPPDYKPCAAVLLADPSKAENDTWAWGGARKYVHPTDMNARPFYVLEAIDGTSGGYYDDVEPIVDRVSKLATHCGAGIVHSDQYEAFSLKAEFRRVGLDFVEHPWTNANKAAAVSLVRTWLTSGVLCLPEHAELKQQMARFQERILKTGTIAFEGKGSHDDYVSLVLMMAAVTLEHQMPSFASGIPDRAYGNLYGAPVHHHHSSLDFGPGQTSELGEPGLSPIDELILRNYGHDCRTAQNENPHTQIREFDQNAFNAARQAAIAADRASPMPQPEPYSPPVAEPVEPTTATSLWSPPEPIRWKP